MKKVWAFAVVSVLALAGLSVVAGENLLPAEFIQELCRRPNTGVGYLKAEGAMPEGITVTTDRAHDPVYRVETSGVVPCAVKKGDLVVLTAAVRGTSTGGKPNVLVKFQDKSYVGALRGNLTGGGSWGWCRVTGVANRDYAAGSMRLHVYPWTGCQQLEIRGWKLENFGPLKASALPPLPSAPDWPCGALKAPDAPPPPKPVELKPLTAAERAKKRYVMLKIDDVGNHRGGIHPRFARVAEYLASKKLKSGFGVVVKSIENTPNKDYIAWLKRNAVENGGFIEFWNHGWDHAMNFTCSEDDACDHTKKLTAEYGGTCLEHQKSHLARSQDVFRKHTGLTMQTLGTAGNAGDENTAAALREHPEIKVWIFGKAKTDSGKLVLGRWLNLEHAVGKVSYDTFVRNYLKNRQRDYVVLQGHAAMWSDAMFEDFKRIVELLESEGWIFTTPAEYLKLRNSSGAGH